MLNTGSKTDLHLNGYLPIFRRDRHPRSGPGGGVALYVPIHLVASRKDQFEIDGIELLCVELVSNHTKILMCVCYRPPDSPVRFWDDIQQTYDLIRQAGYDRIVITGDLNADPRTANGKKLDHFVNSNSLAMYVNNPTRITYWINSSLQPRSS